MPAARVTLIRIFYALALLLAVLVLNFSLMPLAPGDVADTIWWENNKEMSPEGFDNLYADMLEHMKGKDYYVQDLVGGADPAYSINVRMVTELAWHNLFIRHMLRRPDRSALDGFLAEFTVINCPSFQANPERHNCRTETVIAMNFEKKLILIGGTEYAGENKKSVFTLLNYLLPDKGVMPMHCSANHAKDNPVDTAIFFTIAFAGSLTFLEPANDVSWAGEALPLLGSGPVAPLWVSLAVADWMVKLSLALIALLPFRAIVRKLSPDLA